MLKSDKTTAIESESPTKAIPDEPQASSRSGRAFRPVLATISFAALGIVGASIYESTYERRFTEYAEGKILEIGEQNVSIQSDRDPSVPIKIESSDGKTYFAELIDQEGGSKIDRWRFPDSIYGNVTIANLLLALEEGSIVRFPTAYDDMHETVNMFTEEGYGKIDVDTVEIIEL